MTYGPPIVDQDTTQNYFRATLKQEYIYEITRMFLASAVVMTGDFNQQSNISLDA